VRPTLRQRQLCEDDPGHHGLYEHSEARLQHQQRVGIRAVRLHHAEPVADGVLGLNGEQQRGGEVVHVSDTRFPVRVVRMLGVAVCKCDDEPDRGEGEPAHDECGHEHDQVVAPLHVHDRREDVYEVFTLPLRHVLARDVTAAVFEDQPSSPSGGEQATSLGDGVPEPDIVDHRVWDVGAPVYVGTLRTDAWIFVVVKSDDVRTEAT